MRTLVIGDIHGCLTSLKALWKAVAPTKDDHIIFLGDYVDRGPDSKGVIDFLIGVSSDYNITFLTGNHEEKMLLALQYEFELSEWIRKWDAQATLDSYGADSPSDVPQSHWDFIEHCKPYYQTDTHIFVHANLDHRFPIEEQQPYVIIHKKLGTPSPHCSGKTVVLGHTAQKNHLPFNAGHTICIDTDAGRDGWLTCLDVDSGNYWQSNEAGESRTGLLE